MFKLTSQYQDNLPSFIESQNSFENIPLRTRLDGDFEELPAAFETAKKKEHILVSEAGDFPLGQSLSLQKDEQVRTPECRVRSCHTGQTSKTRLRHEDSQIQFAAIESSPLNPQALNSQTLTDHQKEVRTRQYAEGCALFPDIFSSPVPKAANCEDLVVPSRSNASPGASDGARPAALTEELNHDPLAPMDQDATILDVINNNIASSPPEISRETDLVPQARETEAREETGLRSQMPLEAATSSLEEEFNPSTSNLVNLICKNHMKVHNVQQAHQHGVRQPNTAAPVDEITAPAVIAFVADVARASGHDILGDRNGESNMSRRVRVNLEKRLDRQRESPLTKGRMSAIPCLSPKPSISLIQDDRTDKACMGELQNQYNAVGDPEMNASAEGVQAQELVVEDPGTTFVCHGLANQKADINDERPGPHGCEAGEVTVELHLDGRVCADQSYADQRKLDGSDVALEASISLYPEEHEPDAPTSSPQTRRLDVFVDAPSSPLAEHPQVFVDASQTLMPISSNFLNNLEPPQLESDAAPLESAEPGQRTVQSSDGINSRVEDSFLGLQGPLPPDTEVDPLRVSGGDNDQFGSQTSIADSQTTPRKTRKRKKSSWVTGRPAKRHKLEVCPALPALLNDIDKVSLRKEQDEDIGDCIIVATQPSQSPQMSYHSPDANSVSRPKRTRAKPSHTKKSRLSQDIASRAQNSRKRPLTPLRHQMQEGEGHATSRSSMDEPRSPKRRKRTRYSQEDDARATNPKPKSITASPPVKVFSHVEIPVYTKHCTLRNVKQQTLQATDLHHTSRTAHVRDQRGADLTAGVDLMIPTVEDAARVLQPSGLGPDQEGSQVSQQVYAELEASLNTPVSSQDSAREKGGGRASNGILARLKGILQDCKQMILGSSQEEREFDDVLFHLRRELHEAGRRGRTF